MAFAYGLFFVVFLCGCVGGESVKNGTSTPRIIAFSEDDPLADFEAQMTRPRVPLCIGGVTIETCTDLFAAIQRGDDLSFVFLTRPFATYYACFELPLLCHAQMAEQNYWRAEGLAEQVYRRLDLGTFGTSLWPRRTADSHGYSDFDLPAPEISANGFAIETEDWYYALWLRAIADFDGDGVADVLAEFVDHAKRASYFEISPVILSRDSIGQHIRGQRVITAVLDGTLETWPDDPMTCEQAN